MEQFQRNIRHTFGKEGERWLKNLPAIRDSLQELWGISSIAPVANMSFHYVATGTQHGTRPIVLKVGIDKELTKREASVLEACDGNGYVRLLEYSDTLNALLMERLQPGYSLKMTSMPLHDVMAIYGKVEQRIDIPSPDHALFPTVADWLEALDTVTYPVNYQPLQTKALEVRDHLLAETTESLLMHGDLHLDNILFNGDEWVCIDPKGVVGDRGFEIAAFDIFAKEELDGATREAFHERVCFLSKKTAYPAQKLADWFFLRLNLSASWGIQAGIQPGPALELAQLL